MKKIYILIFIIFSCNKIEDLPNSSIQYPEIGKIIPHVQINTLNKEKLSELCEEFLTNHEAAMNILFKYCSEFGLIFDSQEIKDNMTIMHKNGDFDNIVCFGIELSENQLYKKFHPS